MGVVVVGVVNQAFLKQGAVAHANVIPEDSWPRGRGGLRPVASEHAVTEGENSDGAPSLVGPKWTAGSRLLCLIITGGARSPISPAEWNELHRGHGSRHRARPGDFVH